MSPLQNPLRLGTHRTPLPRRFLPRRRMIRSLHGLPFLLRPLKRALIPRREILRRIGPHERLIHLDQHFLDAARTEPFARRGSLGSGGVLTHLLLLDEGAHVADRERVGVEEVVAEIEFVEVEGDEELGEGWGEFGGAEEG